MFPFDWLLQPNPPNATIGVMLISMVITFTTTLANRLLVDQKKMREWRAEVSKWSSSLREAQKKGDKKLIEKLKKQEKKMMKIQAEMFKQSMKVSLIFFIPLIIIWQLIISVYGAGEVVYIPGLFGLSVVWWYLLCSLLFGILFSKLLGVSTGVSE